MKKMLLCLILLILQNSLMCMDSSVASRHYRLARANNDYTIFNIPQNLYNKGMMPIIISFLKLTQENQATVFRGAFYNPQNKSLYNEFKQYLKLEQQSKDNGTFEKFHDQMSCLQQSRILVIRLKFHDYYQTYRNKVPQYHLSSFLEQLHNDKQLPNPLIIEHLKQSKKIKKA